MSIKIENERNYLTVVQLATNKSFKPPIIWLRDNCQCHDRLDKVTSTRRIDWRIFNLNKGTSRDAKVRLIGELMWFMAAKFLSGCSSTQPELRLEINWCDEHSSWFEFLWLGKRWSERPYKVDETVKGTLVKSFVLTQFWVKLSVLWLKL